MLLLVVVDFAAAFFGKGFGEAFAAVFGTTLPGVVLVPVDLLAAEVAPAVGLLPVVVLLPVPVVVPPPLARLPATALGALSRACPLWDGSGSLPSFPEPPSACARVIFSWC